MLQAVGVSVVAGGTRILRNVSIGMRPGDLLAVIGPNGAGKSTLLHALSGARRPDTGETLLDGRPLRRWRPGDLARRRAVLAQTSVLTFPFRVLDLVLLGRSAFAGRASRTDDLRIAEAALREADALHLIEHTYPTLSGGERQRVQFARVLAQIWPPDDGSHRGQGRYLLLDEPTNNLDIAHQHAIMAIARRVCDVGVGVVAVLHDPNLAAASCDRVCVMNAGEIVAECPPATVITEDLFAEVFGIRVTALPHPIHGRPYFVPA